MPHALSLVRAECHRRHKPHIVLTAAITRVVRAARRSPDEAGDRRGDNEATHAGVDA